MGGRKIHNFKMEKGKKLSNMEICRLQTVSSLDKEGKIHIINIVNFMGGVGVVRTDWLQMLLYQQEFHHLARSLLSQSQKQTLTASERELLALLYLASEESTPLALSKSSGMKKEAVSRCLKRLYEKGCIQKKRHPQDERSYILSLTDKGRTELQISYRALLQPLYDLQRRMGPEFDTLFQLIRQANERADEE